MSAVALGITACKTTEQTPAAPAAPPAAAPAHDHSSHSHKQASSSTSSAAKPASGEKICPVSGEVIEDPVVVVYEGQSIELCCKGCKKEFLADPTAYLTKN